MNEDSFFTRLAQDLLNLEINTIIKADMSACKMPATRRIALNQLSRSYHQKLIELGVREPCYWLFAGMRSFEELRDRAQAGQAKYQEDEKKIPVAAEAERARIHEDLDMLERIRDQSSQIANMFRRRAPKEMQDATFSLQSDQLVAERWLTGGNKIEELRDKVRLQELQDQLRVEGMQTKDWNNDVDRDSMNTIPDLGLKADEITLIRKAWDIGTERIVLQTVIQLDGDVTTRMSERFAANPNETVLKIHNQAVLTSTGFWSDLVKILSGIAGKAFSSIISWVKPG